MCKWGTDVEVENLLTVDGERRTWKIDACLAPIVKALNEGGVGTIASCCGHGKDVGRIDLTDGRVLSVFVDLVKVASDQELLAKLERRGVLSWRFRWNGSTHRMRLVSAWEPADDELAATYQYKIEHPEWRSPPDVSTIVASVAEAFVNTGDE